jgi:glutaminase
MKPTTLQRYLERLYEQFAGLNAGAVADYIPELSKANPEWFGIAIVTIDGHVYQVGNSREEFSIQSISKAFTYGIALEDRGDELVASKIDVEPSGEAFNSISLEPDTGRPRNPMINAGAIVATSLVKGDNSEEKIARILEKFAAYTGHGLSVDQAVYASEKTTGHRNRAIAHLLRNYDILAGDPEQPLDAYFQQCSILVNARDLALMGATLANDGVNPITGVRALQSPKVSRVLSVMATCGMYDYSGNWIYNVGMPAKSGVGGGVVAVLPGQLGLAVFSPRLDPKGNSVRGIAVCEALSRDFGLHMLRVTRTTNASVIRASYTGDQVHSKLNRDMRSSAFLEQQGEVIQILELTGELMFVSAELIATQAVKSMENKRILIIDLSRVTSIDQSAMSQLLELTICLMRDNKSVLFANTKNHYHFTRFVQRGLGQANLPGVLEYDDLDLALEQAEEHLLSDSPYSSYRTTGVADLREQPLCRNFDTEELALLESLLEKENYKAGQRICHEGEKAERLFFLTKGRVSASVQLDHKRRHRLSASAAGWAFGESALFHEKRTADIFADTDVDLLSLCPERLMAQNSPLATRLMIKMLSNLAALTLNRLGKANQEIRILTR